jgi:hypothetical protein
VAEKEDRGRWEEMTKEERKNTKRKYRKLANMFIESALNKAQINQMKKGGNL